MFARCGAASWFLAWLWRRLRPMPAWAEPAAAVAAAALELQPEREPAVEALELRPGQEAAERELAAVGAAEQFIARMAKLS
jgi:hypothetical protein